MTREDVLRAFAEADAKIAAERAERLRPKPSATMKSQERWTPKPEAVFTTAAAHNEAALELARQAQVRQSYQTQLDYWFMSVREAHREEHSLRQVGGFLEGGPNDYNPVDRL
jgi:hypothetical protein